MSPDRNGPDRNGSDRIGQTVSLKIDYDHENNTNDSFSIAYLVHRPHSQITMRILSLNLFHKFVEIRACGRQRTPEVVFWLKLVLVLGFKNSYIVKKHLHNGM